MIRYLVDNEIASTKDGVVDELIKIGLTKTDAIAAFDRCEVTEDRTRPTSYWGIAQGLTRMSQDRVNSDDRQDLDMLAAAVLRRGARRLVAA